MSNDHDSQGGMGRDSMEERDGFSSQENNAARNGVSTNVKNPSSNWNTP
ncbi:MAG TPA: hypothetical protein VK530_18125 [Candidatus Acidoferrum sp.]|nr:hypothetical protein [Candidatus Acidoferrum sp.]